MAGILRIEWQQLTLRMLWIEYQAYTLETWDHTSRLLCAWGKKGSKPEQFHPYRTTQRQRSIKPKNIQDLTVMLG